MRVPSTISFTFGKPALLAKRALSLVVAVGHRIYNGIRCITIISQNLWMHRQTVAFDIPCIYPFAWYWAPFPINVSAERICCLGLNELFLRENWRNLLIECSIWVTISRSTLNVSRNTGARKWKLYRLYSNSDIRCSSSRSRSSNKSWRTIQFRVRN